MNFPLINISVKKWHKDADVLEFILFDKFIYTDKDCVFEELYKWKSFCDGDGFVYKAIKKEEQIEKWRNWLRFIPNVWRKEIIFKKTGEKLTVEELRQYLLDRVSDLSKTDFRDEWINELRIAKTHFELINGKKEKTVANKKYKWH